MQRRRKNVRSSGVVTGFGTRGWLVKSGFQLIFSRFLLSAFFHDWKRMILVVLIRMVLMDHDQRLATREFLLPVLVSLLLFLTPTFFLPTSSSSLLFRCHVPLRTPTHALSAFSLLSIHLSRTCLRDILSLAGIRWVYLKARAQKQTAANGNRNGKQGKAKSGKDGEVFSFHFLLFYSRSRFMIDSRLA